MLPAGPTEFDLAHTYGGMPFGTLPIRPIILSYLTDYARTHVNAPFITAVSVESCLEEILAPDASTLHWDFKNDPDPPIEPFAPALFFGTSGSTATSKLVAQSHYNAAVNAEALRRHHRLRRGDRILGCLPIHHVNCLHFTIFATLTACGHAILASSFSPFDYPRLIGQFRPRIASVVPSILEALLGIWRQPIFPRA